MRSRPAATLWTISKPRRRARRAARCGRSSTPPSLASPGGARSGRRLWRACRSLPPPLLYVIVASGNIYEDRTAAVAAAEAGAQVIAVIRSTGQSLLDFVPFGPTTEGFGGTYATQANFAIMRAALDDVGEKLGRYVMLTNYASGLCMPEIAVMAALERLDMLLNDSMYGILFRDINMKRTFVDQHFSRMLNAYSGIIINTGEDNYLTTADAVDQAPAVLASQFINEEFAHRAGTAGRGRSAWATPMRSTRIVEDGFLYQVAQAQLAREIFPEAPLKYMPPTKHMTGDIFKGHLIDAMFNLTSVMTGQNIHLCGMPTEAIHTPFLGDRALSLENARYIMNTARHFGDEIVLRPGGIVERRAHVVLSDCEKLLERVAALGLMKAIEAATLRRRLAHARRGPRLRGRLRACRRLLEPVRRGAQTQPRERAIVTDRVIPSEASVSERIRGTVEYR